MKTLFTLFVLFFSLILSSCEQKPLIEDYKIEGIGLGDSLLEHYSKKEILNSTRVYYENDIFVSFESNLDLLENSQYNVLQIRYKSNDEKYIVYSVVGVFYFKDNIEKCDSKKNDLIKEISELLQIDSFEDSSYENSYGSMSGVYKDLADDVTIQIYCSDWNMKTENEKNWTDNLRIEINSKDYLDWLYSLDLNQ